MNRRDLEMAEQEAEAVEDAVDDEMAAGAGEDVAAEEAESAADEYDETAEVLAEVESALNLDEEE